LHLSCGDLLRDEVKKGTEIGRECEQLMKDGKLVPVEVTLKLLKKAMKEGKKANAKGFLIDGFPRAVDQAEMFENKVNLAGIPCQRMEANHASQNMTLQMKLTGMVTN
jgi:adenylate kinase family enzyme